MEANEPLQPNPRIPGVRRKPIDNPARPKPLYASDENNAVLLERVLRQVPANLIADAKTPFPLLAALARLDAVHGTDLARQLVLIGAATHHSADERRTAEYLLRNRARLLVRREPAMRLVRAARCAAEMDERRTQSRETPTPVEGLSIPAPDPAVQRLDAPSVGEVVIDRLQEFTGLRPSTSLVRDRLLDAVTIALELSERHNLNRGKQPSLIAMRANARRTSRLVTHLRQDFDDDTAARRVARMLVGSEDTPLESALLWWSAMSNVTSSDVPIETRDRWASDFRAADSILASRGRAQGSTIGN